jgi:hypothetical protein
VKKSVKRKTKHMKKTQPSDLLRVPRPSGTNTSGEHEENRHQELGPERFKQQRYSTRVD